MSITNHIWTSEPLHIWPKDFYFPVFHSSFYSATFQFYIHPIGHFRVVFCLCQNESKCETIHMICTYRFISRWSNSFLYERFHTKTRFETEAQGYIHPWAAHRSLWSMELLLAYEISRMVRRKQNNYFVGMWCECVFKSEKSHSTFQSATDTNLLLLCLIFAALVVQDSLILIIFLLSCKPQGTWYQADKSTHIPNVNNNTLRDPLKNNPQDHNYWSSFAILELIFLKLWPILGCFCSTIYLENL